MSQLIDPQSDRFQLAEQASLALNKRLASHSSFSQSEIDKICGLDCHLLPCGGVIDPETLERLRALARLSRCSLTSPERISSHRRYVGQLIVLAKRAIWPFLSAQLKGTLDAQEEFNSLILESFIRELSTGKTLSLPVIPPTSA